MLGSLARWLRFLGYDTLYPGPAGDDDILRLAREEGRIIVTRDRGLAARAGPGAILLSSLVLDEQILQLRGAAGLDLDGPGRMMRCPKCNSVLTATTKEEVEKLARGGSASGQAIPENILGRHSEFWRCPGCGQVYWHGSHYDRIIGKIGELEKGSRQ
jgi:hypothetical protein